jgi:hypothetical protein
MKILRWAAATKISASMARQAAGRSKPSIQHRVALLQNLGASQTIFVIRKGARVALPARRCAYRAGAVRTAPMADRRRRPHRASAGNRAYRQ